MTTTKEILLPNNYTLKLYKKKYLPQLSDFVASIYFNQCHYQFDEDIETLANELRTLDEELSKQSTICCIYNIEKDICCTGRLIKRVQQLPFEIEFDINLDLFQDKYSNIYEFARLASGEKSSFRLVKILTTQLFSSVDSDSNMIVASLDQLVYRKLVRLKYPVFKLGKERHYMGSVTVPVGFDLSKIKMWERSRYEN